ncbi:MAG: HlyD family efflux transporter periplasmic adaptor subunit [Defluviitaleaceae bacterium]|nr:HlyD family efflux transporter periplasmic adaptor subunit [Defluviitaleaceae bacterium]
MNKIFCMMACFVCLSALLTACASNDVLPTTTILDNRSSSTPDSITVRGVVESVESRNIYSTLGFVVERVYAEVGDDVTEGQVLAVLDTEDLSLKIAQQKVELELVRQMMEIIPPQRQAELESIRQMSTLAPRRQQSELNLHRQNTANMLQQSQRMYNEATENLANNTNMHIISAEANLTVAELNLNSTRLNYNMARADYDTQSNPHVTAAESLVIGTRLALETITNDHYRLQRLYEAGGISRNDLNQIETALTHSTNAYSDALTNLQNAKETERRNLEQLEIALYAATATFRDAQSLLDTTKLAAVQELDMLRSHLTAAEIAANIEPMEIAANMSIMEITTNLTAMENAITLELKELAATSERLEIALQLMERQLADSIIIAPISGTVTAAIAREGSSGMGLMFVVADTENLRVITHFREYDIPLLYQGMAVTIVTDNSSHIGTIRRISPAAALHSHIVEFEVEIELPAQTGLLIGMNTRITPGGAE